MIIYNEITCQRSHHLFPIRHSAEEIVTDNLVLYRRLRKAPLRARSVMGTQHSVTVADAGSNPAGSILPFVEERFLFEEKTQR